MGNVSSSIIAKSSLFFKSKPFVWRAEEGLKAESLGSASLNCPLGQYPRDSLRAILKGTVTEGTEQMLCQERGDKNRPENKWKGWWTWGEYRSASVPHEKRQKSLKDSVRRPRSWKGLNRGRTRQIHTQAKRGSSSESSLWTSSGQCLICSACRSQSLEAEEMHLFKYHKTVHYL